MDAAAQELKSLVEQFAEDFKNQDFARLAEIYTDDATMLPPGSQMVSGRANIQSFWQQFRQVQEFEFQTAKVTRLADDMLCELGTLLMTPQAGQQGQAQEVPGKYLFLWRKTDGEWKIDTAIWNRSAAGGGGRGRGAGRGGQGRGGPRRRGGLGGAGGGGGGGAGAAFVPRVR